MVDINITLIFQTINFLALYWLMDTVLFKPLLRVMDERKAKFTSLAEGFAEEKEEIQGLDNQHKQKLYEIHSEASSIRRGARDEASEESQQLLVKAKKEADKIFAGKVETLDKDLNTLESELEGQVGEIEEYLVSKIVPGKS